MFALFGPTLASRATLLATDIIVVGDIAADASGATGVKVPATALVYKDVSGKVGLGTVTPGTLLDLVNGQGRFTFPAAGISEFPLLVRYSAAFSPLAIGQGGDGVCYIINQHNSSLAFGTNGVERLWINTSGDVGIGTTTPDSKLQVIAGAVASLRIGFATGSVNYMDANDNIFRLISGTEIFRANSSGIRPGSDNALSMGTGSLRWSVVYAGTGTINTSDERQKTDIGAVPDEWLDAWAEVEWQRFKMIDGRRWHIGLVAQRVHAVFAAHGIDAFEIGLCCFDQWEEETRPVYETVIETEKVEVETGEVYKSGPRKGEAKTKTVSREVPVSVDTGKTEVTLEAGDRWGLRYDECQAIEAALQRRTIHRQGEAILALQSQLEALSSQG